MQNDDKLFVSLTYMKILPKIPFIIFSFLLLFFATLVFVKISNAESVDDIAKQIEETAKDLEKTDKKLSDIKKTADEISEKVKELSNNLGATQSQVNSLQNQIAQITKDLAVLNTKLEIKNQELEKRKKIRDLTIRDLYISSKTSLFELLLEPNTLSNAAQNAIYHLSFVDSSEHLIGSINKEVTGYQNDKKEIEEIKAQVEKQKKDLQIVLNKVLAQVNSAKGELASISQKKVALEEEKNSIQKKLSELSAKQKALLEEKTDTFSTSVGDVPSTGDLNSQASYNPGFKPAFAAFSFGAPHRKGMSQYGAKGRADQGQDYKKILSAYYGDIEIKEPDLPSTIKTDKGAFDLDGKYLKGLAEMPSSWPMEAMKAQAIAARTYAMAYVGWRTGSTSPSGTICTTESCQVWSSSKASSGSAARWHQAVEETKGMVMISKKTGEIFSAYYAATSGGYNYSYSSLGHTTSGGWDTKCGSKDCWTSDAYESIAGSPWFYKGWYKTRSNKSCGRTHPWLTQEEFSDIIGAMVLYKENKNNQTHLSQPDAKSCWGEDISDTWSRSDVKDKSGISEVKDISVSYSSSGVTAEVKVKTNKGDYTFSGEEFKAIFNLRAPGAIHLKSLLFNIEKK